MLPMLILVGLVLAGLASILVHEARAYSAVSRRLREANAADLARLMRPIEPLQFDASTPAYVQLPLKQQRRTLRPSDRLGMFGQPAAVIRIKSRREELAERRRKDGAEQARFMEVFQLRPEDYA